MKRTPVRRGRLAGAAVAAALVAMTLAGRAGAGGEDHVYVVRAGDTVWAVAERVAGPREDPRPIVDAIIARNELRDGLIVPGQHLVLPR